MTFAVDNDVVEMHRRFGDPSNVLEAPGNNKFEWIAAARWVTGLCGRETSFRDGTKKIRF